MQPDYKVVRSFFIRNSDKMMIIPPWEEIGIIGGEPLFMLDGSSYIVPVSSHPVCPKTHQVEELGQSGREWGKAWLKDLHVSGTAQFPNSGLGILDTDASHRLILSPASNLSAQRTLSLITGDADRSITLQGNPTLNDWFDQSVKQVASPTFAGMTLTGFSGFVKATAGVLSAAALTDADIPDDITLTNITQITNRSHTNLSDIGSLSHATIDGYLDQAVKQASSPTFAGLTLTGFSGYVKATAGILSADVLRFAGLFEIDINENFMPRTTVESDLFFELDINENIIPSPYYFEVDANSNIMPSLT